MHDDWRTSGLLPVHADVAPEHLNEALASLWAQTLPLDEIVLVEDGPLIPALDAVVDHAIESGGRLVRVRLGSNGGAGVSNQAGLEAASHPWIFKMDSDDISTPDRLETLMRAARERDLDVVGGAMAEFSSESARPDRTRRVPVEHEEIRSRMRWNNPMNHPTVLFRRDLAQAAGGYPPLRSMQDYGLFIAMMAAGARFGNVEDVVTLFRADAAMRSRRTGLRRHWRNELAISRALAQLPGTTALNRSIILTARLTARSMPTRLIAGVSNLVLTSPSGRVS